MDLPREDTGKHTSAQLFHLRLADEDEDRRIYRTPAPSIDHRQKAPAEVVLWRDGWLEWYGVLVDPALADVPIRATAPFKWLCRRRLLKQHKAADEFGRHAAWEVCRRG